MLDKLQISRRHARGGGHPVFRVVPEESLRETQSFVTSACVYWVPAFAGTTKTVIVLFDGEMVVDGRAKPGHNAEK